MPRGPVVASPVPGAVPQNPGDVIQSSVWNATVNDIYNIFNTIQPIEYGGNGVSDGKPLDNSFGIKNSTDPTKVGVFSAAGIPPATTRIYTLPDESGTLALTTDVGGNIGLTASVAANAMTISIKGSDGNDPSASNTVNINFRNVTPGNGTPTNIAITAATSLVISSGSTLGVASATPFKVWIVAFNDGGTVRLGAMVATTLVSGALSQYPLASWGIASSTAEGGGGGADSAQTFYTGTAVASKAYTVLGYLSFETGLATAGTWSSAPTRVQTFDASTPLPGHRVQVARSTFGGVQVESGLIPRDDTIPQITEGDQYMSQAITPSAATNLLIYTASGFWGVNTNDRPALALFRDAGADALVVMDEAPAGSPNTTIMTAQCVVLAGSTNTTTFSARAGGAVGGLTFNGFSSARLYGGAAGSYNVVEEIAS